MLWKAVKSSLDLLVFLLIIYVHIQHLDIWAKVKKLYYLYLLVWKQNVKITLNSDRDLKFRLWNIPSWSLFLLCGFPYCSSALHRLQRMIQHIQRCERWRVWLWAPAGGQEDAAEKQRNVISELVTCSSDTVTDAKSLGNYRAFYAY